MRSVFSYLCTIYLCILYVLRLGLFFVKPGRRDQEMYDLQIFVTGVLAGCLFIKYEWHCILCKYTLYMSHLVLITQTLPEAR